MNPSREDKKHYRDFVLELQYTLPCGKCRTNLKKNFEKLPLTLEHMKNRKTFSRYIFRLHELVNKMLGKKSGLTYGDVRERYEHFRANCKPSEKMEATPPVEKGCTEPMKGKKSKCILTIIPDEQKCETFQIKNG